jgi:hypothetical protein
MVLLLHRTYHPSGVNGELYIHGVFVCHTIELPWLNNKPNSSCIPEGTYVLQKRWSPRHKWHLIITGVKGRSFILIHPANDAIVELRGCIAPVTTLTGIAKGTQSRMAFQKLTSLVFPAIKSELVLLTIMQTPV